MINKTALITGSTSGIGLSIAKAFAATGYNLVVNGLEEDGPAIASEINRKYNIECLFSPANMLQPAELDALVRQCANHFGSVDILINNAGVQHVSPIDKFPVNKWNEIIAVNLTAPFHLIKGVWPYMKNQNFGRIINIASIHALVASELKSAYVASKHGLLGLTKTAALEGAPYNITCNAICPGYVRTPLVEKQIPDQMLHHNLTEDEVIAKIMLAKQSVKEFVSADLIAQMALLMASDVASSLTGSILPIDGGWSAQ